jgi:hypothetical protein
MLMADAYISYSSLFILLSFPILLMYMFIFSYFLPSFFLSFSMLISSLIMPGQANRGIQPHHLVRLRRSIIARTEQHLPPIMRRSTQVLILNK